MFGRRPAKPSRTAAEDAERRALFEQLALRPENVCPFLGLVGARVDYEATATDDHRCHAFGEAEPVSGEQQRTVCLQRGYVNCPRYLRGVLVIPTEELAALRRSKPVPPPVAAPPPPLPPPAAPSAPVSGGRRWVFLLAVAVLLGGGATAWWAWTAGPLAANRPTPSPSLAATASPTRIPSPEATPSGSQSAKPTGTPTATPIVIVGTDQFVLVGRTVRLGDTLRLTPSVPARGGGAWIPEPTRVADGFVVEFEFRIADNFGAGGDGVAFVIQTSGPQALGARGGQIGYGGLANSLAVEIDTFFNDWPGIADPAGHHLSVHSSGPGVNGGDERFALAPAVALPDMSDGAPHSVRISYVPGELTVAVDDEVLIRVAVDLEELLDLPSGGSAWIGFTGSTGSAAETNDILSFRFEAS